MSPVKFPEVNVTYAEDQAGYKPLPVFKNNSTNGEVVSCWKLSFFERLRVLWTGELWLMMLTFNKPLTPSFLSTNKKDVLTIKKMSWKNKKVNPKKKISGLQLLLDNIQSQETN